MNWSDVICQDMDQAFAIWSTIPPCGDKVLAEFDLILVTLASTLLMVHPCDGIGSSLNLLSIVNKPRYSSYLDQN